MEDRYINQINEICKEANFDSAREDNLFKGLEKNPELEEELTYFLDNRDFLCKTKVAGFSIVDILVWQIDHFRFYLDRDTSLTRNNPSTMALLAVETMMNMSQNPEKYISEYGSETGTDQII